MDIRQLRISIDQIDSQIIDLFQQRMNLCAQVASYKEANNLPIFDAAREKEKIESIMASANPEMADYAASLFSKIMDISKEYQSQLIHNNEVI